MAIGALRSGRGVLLVAEGDGLRGDGERKLLLNAEVAGLEEQNEQNRRHGYRAGRARRGIFKAMQPATVTTS